MVIVGAGAVGCEFADVFHAFGKLAADCAGADDHHRLRLSRMGLSSDEMTVRFVEREPNLGRPRTREPVAITSAFFASCFSSLPISSLGRRRRFLSGDGRVFLM